MADASRSELPRRVALGAVDTWRRLNFEQRVAAVASLLLLVSTFGPFSFVEGATLLTALAVLLLLRKRAQKREFHIPFGDGAVIAAAGVWAAFLIIVRLPDRPFGQTLLALVCAALLVIAGLAERRTRPADDLPGPAPEEHQRGPDAVEWEEPTAPMSERRSRVGASDAATRVRRRRSRKNATSEAIPREREDGQLEIPDEPPPAVPTEPLPPPEFKLPEE
jgi:hypothetical protein